MNYVSIALKAAPYVLIALLIGVVLWMRNDLTATKADRDKAQAAVAELGAVNAANAKEIEQAKAAAAINDQAVIDLNKQIFDLRAKSLKSESNVQRIIVNDPKSKIWADMPVPDELRNAIN
jgi:hypothetical protein